jgi:hypothetical protein
MGCGSSSSVSISDELCIDGVVYFFGPSRAVGKGAKLKQLSFGMKGHVVKQTCRGDVVVCFPLVGNAVVKVVELSQTYPVIPGGYQLDEEVYYSGPTTKYPDGDRLVFGAAGKISGRSVVGDGKDDDRIAVSFPGHKMPKALRCAFISYEPPVIPGGFSVGDLVFWCGMDWSFPNKDKLHFGAQGTVTGRACSPDGIDNARVAVSFPGNKGSVVLRVPEISKDPPVLPGGYHVGDRVFYTYPNTKTQEGFVLTFGVEGKLVGRSCIGDGRDDQRVWVSFQGCGYGCIHLEQISKDRPVIPGNFKLGEVVYFSGANRTVGHLGQRVEFGMMGKVTGGREARSEVTVDFEGIDDAVDLQLLELSSELPKLPKGFALGDAVYWGGAAFCTPDGHLVSYGGSGEIVGRSCKGDGHDEDRIAVHFLGCRGSSLVQLHSAWKEFPPKLEEKLTIQLQKAKGIPMIAATYRAAKVAGIDHIRDQAWKAGMLRVEGALKNGNVASLSQLLRAAEDALWPELEDHAALALEELVLPRTMQAAKEANDEVAMNALERYIRKRSPVKSILASSNASSGHDNPGRLDNLQYAEGRRSTLILSPRVLKQDHGAWSEHRPYAEPGPQDTLLIKQMQEFVDQTYTAWGGYGKETCTRDRHNAKASNRIEVVAVEQLQNDKRHMMYSMRQQIIEAELSKECQADWNCQPDWNVKTDPASSLLTMVKPLNSQLNEHYLWHGTGPVEARGIASSGFDLSRAGCGRGALFGHGAYFAESCLKADEYVKPDERGWHPLILSRVTLGRVRYCDAEDPGELKESLRSACRSQEYHSVLGDREKVRQTFREFVLFDSSQIDPEFIIWYVRP